MTSFVPPKRISIPSDSAQNLNSGPTPTPQQQTPVAAGNNNMTGGQSTSVAGFGSLTTIVQEVVLELGGGQRVVFDFDPQVDTPEALADELVMSGVVDSGTANLAFLRDQIADAIGTTYRDVITGETFFSAL